LMLTRGINEHPTDLGRPERPDKFCQARKCRAPKQGPADT
jgi:hypothetical protein